MITFYPVIPEGYLPEEGLAAAAFWHRQAREVCAIPEGYLEPEPDVD